MLHTGLQLVDPIEMLLLLDEDILNGTTKLHKWQIQILKDFAIESTAENPYRAVLRAANGSGKDKYIIASCVVWFAMRYPQSVAVVTSASGTQLDRQTNTFIEQLCRQANKRVGFDLWKINYRHYECQFPKEDGTVDTSMIELFVTDESGRAEGWHPIIPNGQLAIFTSEAKSISDEIFQALSRCTGFTKRMDVSSPGRPDGHFFNKCTSGNWTKYHVTAYDCPHLSASYIEDLKNEYAAGEDSWVFKSAVMAEFGSMDEMVVIPYHRVWKAMYDVKVPHVRENHNVAGLDLSAGGDETVLAVRNGNKLVSLHGFKFDDTNQALNHIEKLLKDNQLNNNGSYIYGDAGGLGKPMLDQLRARGWTNIRYVLNQGTPADKRAYYNRGAELWFMLNKYMEAGEIILPQDDKLKRQLSTRYYKLAENNRAQLESKLQARAKGHPSPDRADAVVLAFSNYRSKFADEVVREQPLPKQEDAVVKSDGFVLKSYVKESNSNGIYAGVNRTLVRDTSHIQNLVKEHNELVKQKQII